MKKIVLALVVVLGVTAIGCSNGVKKVEGKDLVSTRDSVSYIIGNGFGTQLHKQELDINVDVLVSAFSQAFSGDTSIIAQSAVQRVMQKFQVDMQKKAMEKRELASKKSKAKGLAFLEANKAKEGVVVTESGLQYQILKEGKGEKPSATDKVKVHYHGTTIDGKVFDSSVDRGEPATFPVNGVIKGWTEALQLMPVGSKWKLVIPSELAYGEAGAGELIPANSVLVFEVELLSIEK